MTIKIFIKKLVPPFILSLYHYKMALLGAMLSGFPGKSENIKIIGVTGTSGKSTTVNFITNILEEAGYNVASISSIRFKMGKGEWQNKYKMTMPGRFVIQQFLRRAVNARCGFVVLEVTSEGIRQFRHKFIDFDCAVFTNLTPEHIESHGGFENYRAEKMKLFQATKHIHVINQDDANTKYFWDIPAKEKIGFHQNDLPFTLQLEGTFNMANAAAAMATAKAYGVNAATCQTALQKITTVPGRMEIISEHPKVVVDYAHTPEQLEQVYQSLAPQKLICVLGSCGGGRDIWKRPILGKIASRHCSQIFLTNEDPYDEDPMEIINEIAAMAGDAKIILNRKEAIEAALAAADKNDAVIITGKGSESWMCLENGKKIPWDDRQIVKEALLKSR